MKAMAITMFGNPSTKSIKRDNQRSMLGVENPANPPIAIPMAPLMPMMVKAIPKEAYHRTKYETTHHDRAGQYLIDGYY